MIRNITIFNKEFSFYMIIALIGYFISGIYACYRFKQKGQDENNMISFYLALSVGTLLGGHILFGITNFYYLICLFQKLFTLSFDSVSQFFLACQFVFGGSVFYGGLIGGLISGSLYLKYKKYDFGLYADTIAPCIPLFHFFGRLGCFFSGCCYGIESKIGFTYHNSLIEAANGVRRFPIQLVEAGINLVLFIVLSYLESHNKCKKKLLLYYLTIYPICRFILEYFRGDTYRGFVGCFSTSQFISILILVCVLCYTIYQHIHINKQNIGQK